MTGSFRKHKSRMLSRHNTKYSGNILEAIFEQAIMKNKTEEIWQFGSG
jgi:hypothetical protein